MSIYTLRRVQLIKRPIEEVWDFFSSPKNLKKLTPPEMNFVITEMSRETKAYSGQMIKYRVSVLPGIRLTWLTEITHVQEGNFFVDEQRVGPYKMWHHEHVFDVTPDGVNMTDIITYQMPFGWLGQLMQPFAQKKLDAIFSYRTEQTDSFFQ